MEAILKFDLNDADDREEHARMIKSIDLELALWDISNVLRNITKHNPNDLSDEVLKGWEQAREMVISVISDYEIKLD